MGTLVKAITMVAGQIAYASSVNRNDDDVVSTINALNSANIITSGIDTININASAITPPKVATSAIENQAINNGAVDADKLDGETRFYTEVFT